VKRGTQGVRESERSERLKVPQPRCLHHPAAGSWSSPGYRLYGRSEPPHRRRCYRRLVTSKAAADGAGDLCGGLVRRRFVTAVDKAVELLSKDSFDQAVREIVLSRFGHGRRCIRMKVC